MGVHVTALMFPGNAMTLYISSPQTSLVMSVYLTISVSIERYISVVYPLLSIRSDMANGHMWSPNSLSQLFQSLSDPHPLTADKGQISLSEKLLVPLSLFWISNIKLVYESLSGSTHRPRTSRWPFQP